MLDKIKALWAKLPAQYQKAAIHSAEVFGATFIAVAGPLLPAVIQSPSLSAIHAVVVAGVAAGARAAWSAIKVVLAKQLAS